MGSSFFFALPRVWVYSLDNTDDDEGVGGRGKFSLVFLVLLVS